MTLVVGALVVVAVLQTLLIVGLLRSHGEILRRIHALDGGFGDGGAGDAALGNDPNVPVDFRVRPELPQPGDSTTGDTGEVGDAHDLVGVGLDDDVVTVSVSGARHRTLLAFLSSNCLTCHAFWDAFAGRDDLGLPNDVRVVVVPKDPSEESLATLRTLRPLRTPVVLSSAAWLDYAVPGSPYFVLVDGVTRRVIGEGTGLRWEQVRKLLTEAVNASDDDRNEARIDRALLASGVRPGDPSLYHPRITAPGSTGSSSSGTNFGDNG
jgi:hypothetical protein